MSANCEAIVIFPIVGIFGAIRKPDSGRIVYKTFNLITIISSKILSYKKRK